MSNLAHTAAPSTTAISPRTVPLWRTGGLAAIAAALATLVEQYVALEGEPDVGSILFEQYLRSDPARWEDWKAAVGRAIADDASTDPLSENLDRDE